MRHLALSLILAASTLSGCNTGMFLGGAANSEVTVTKANVRLAGPRGYCVDPETLQNGDTQAFAIFGNCAAISDTWRVVQPVHQAIAITSVTSLGIVTPRVSDDPDAFVRVFETPEGKAALSRNRTAENIKLNESYHRNDVVFLNITDIGKGGLPGAENTFWRAYFDVGDSLITISVISFQDAPMSRQNGLAALQAFIATTRNQPAT